MPVLPPSHTLTAACRDPSPAASSREMKADNPLNLSSMTCAQRSLAEIGHSGLPSGTLGGGTESISAGESDNEEEVNIHGGLRSNSSSSSTKSPQNKRYRTNLTNLQIHVMKNIFNDYKTPTMAECEVLGSSIGLQKRVVQVWFQNARAKEKKSRLSSSGGSAELSDTVATHCSMCDIQYNHLSTLQDHIFSLKHIGELRRTFNGKFTDTDRLAMYKQEEVRDVASFLVLVVSFSTV